jgi:hypothetical protein
MNEDGDMDADEFMFGYRPPFIGSFVCEVSALDDSVAKGTVNFQYGGEITNPVKIVISVILRDLRETQLCLVGGKLIGMRIANYDEVFGKVECIVVRYLESGLMTG